MLKSKTKSKKVKTKSKNLKLKPKSKVKIQPEIQKTEIKLKPYLWCVKYGFLYTRVCYNLIFTKRCKKRTCQIRRGVMANKSKLTKFLKELGVEFDTSSRTIELAQLLINTVRKINHADDFSPELRRTLIKDYYFKITDEEGNELDEFLEIKGEISNGI